MRSYSTYRLPGVADVQVVSAPSAKYGEEVGAFIIQKPEANYSDEDARDFCRGQISRYVAFVDSYPPMIASGKIQKFKMRELAGKMFPDA